MVCSASFGLQALVPYEMLSVTHLLFQMMLEADPALQPQQDNLIFGTAGGARKQARFNVVYPGAPPWGQMNGLFSATYDAVIAMAHCRFGTAPFSVSHLGSPDPGGTVMARARAKCTHQGFKPLDEVAHQAPHTDFSPDQRTQIQNQEGLAPFSAIM